MLGVPGPQDDFHRGIVSKMVNLLYYRYRQESKKCWHGRSIWAVFISAIETPDSIHRRWLLERLDELRDLTAESEWLYSTAEKILGLQVEPGVPWVDLAEYIFTHTAEE